MGLMRVASKPGIKRDGTDLDSQQYSDGVWCRWQRSLPRKMGGYRVTQPYLSAVSRALFSQAKTGFRYFSSGNSNGIDQFTIDNFGVSSIPVQPTIPGLVANANKTWQFDTQFDNTTNSTLLFALGKNDLLDPTDQTNFPIYYQNVYLPGSTMTVLSPGTGTINVQVSGGICSLAPYMTIFGNDGYFAWSRPGLPTDFDNVANPTLTGATRITNQKLLRGIPLRGGGGNSPAGLYWSIDALVRASFVGGTPTWQFDQLTTQSSVLSDRCILENDGIFYWAGVDRFLMFNGVVQEIPNDMNLNWFFDNINVANSSKSFVMKIPRYGEIWWCYPRGGNVECSHAVIYNYREKIWYDTPLPNAGRSSGIHADNLVGNLMGGLLPYSVSVSGTPTTYFNMWEHETGTDEINGSRQISVPSSFTTSSVSGFDTDPPTAGTLSIGTLLPDFVQSGDMTVEVLKQNNAKDAVYTDGAPGVIYANPANPFQQVTPLKQTAKIFQLRFTSNAPGGDYQMGKTMLEVQADGEKYL